MTLNVSVRRPHIYWLADLLQYQAKNDILYRYRI